MAPMKRYTSRSNKKETNYMPNMSELGKLPPQDTEVEEAVLGALMLEKDA